MASSYRQDLNNGFMKEWETPLREAVEKIQFVIDELYECDSDQQDNRFDEGQLAQKLFLAIRFIEEELPKKCKHQNYTPFYNSGGELQYKICDDCGEEFD